MTAARCALRFMGLLGLALIAGCIFWSYWPTLESMWQRWSDDPQYSHGFLVPVFALVVLWSRRELRPRALSGPSVWGLLLLLVAVCFRLAAAYFYIVPLDGLSLLPLLASLTLLLGGRSLFRWCWPSIAFLGFMLPLPFQMETALAQPLRRLATVASTYALQTLGYPAVADGNIIAIDDLQLGVVDACSGLGMLFTFFALATAAALIIARPLADKLLVVASAIPIAVVVNVFRITITGAAHIAFGPEVGHALMHDFAGWMMMPIAMALIWLELWFLSHLLVEVPSSLPVPLLLPRAAAKQPPAGVGPAPRVSAHGGAGGNASCANTV